MFLKYLEHFIVLMWSELYSLLQTNKCLYSLQTTNQCTTDSPQLKEIPTTLWTFCESDATLMKGEAPVRITPKSDHRPGKYKYPLKPEAEQGIEPVFDASLQSGIIDI